MKEHGILFSAPMVQALLARRKRVTRRMSKRWLRVKAGDRLWVRETWKPRDDGILDAWYRADGHIDVAGWPWKPSIHMPRKFSRITLVATEDARLERLQDITEEEAIAEGVEPRVAGTTWGPNDWACVKNYRTGFVGVWQSLHTKPGERWQENPELVRLAFDYAQ